MKMKIRNMKFIRLNDEESLPYNLLLLADPSKELVDKYLKQSDVFVAIQNGETVGVVVLFPLTKVEAEIKNIAVKPELEGQGIGSYLIKNVIKTAKQRKYQKLSIGTANSSIGPLYLYQKHGFEITDIIKCFFINNYPEPIYEDGLQAKHMIILTKDLTK